jgi:molybdopterin-guanine dinucleotide biosynthesis protein A
MDTKKSFLTIDGVRLSDKILDVYQDIFAEIIIVNDDPLAYTEFSATTVVTDIYKEKGA